MEYTGYPIKSIDTNARWRLSFHPGQSLKDIIQGSVEGQPRLTLEAMQHSDKKSGALVKVWVQSQLCSSLTESPQVSHLTSLGFGFFVHKTELVIYKLQC